MTIEDEIKNALKLNSKDETITELIAMILYYSESPAWRTKRMCLDMSEMMLKKVGFE